MASHNMSLAADFGCKALNQSNFHINIQEELK